jgi:outer membrane protein
MTKSLQSGKRDTLRCRAGALAAALALPVLLPLLAILALLPLLALTSGDCLADGAGNAGPSELGLPEAVGIALEHSTTMEQAASRVASGRISLGQAKAGLLPSLSAGASAGEQYARGGPESDSPGHYQGSGSASAHASSGITVFDGFSNINSIRSASRELAAGEATYERTRQSVVFTVISDYLAVLESGELVSSRRDNLEAQRQQLALVEEYYRAGKRSVADLLQQQAAVANAELQVLSAEQEESTSKLQLTADMGVAPTFDLTVEPLQASAKTIYPIDSTKDAILAAALGLRPDVAAQRNKVSAASIKVAVARSGWWPSLALSAGASSSLLDRAYEDQIGYNVGVSLALPIFDRFQTRASVKQAKISLSDEEASLAELERTVALEVERAILSYETARKKHEVAQAQLDYAIEALRATTARYEVGSSTLAEVAASNAQYVSARNDLVQAAYQLLLGRIVISYYQGNVGEMARILGL